MKMKLSEALIDAVMGWAVVFLGIALLVLVVVLLGKAMTAKKPAAVTAHEAAVAVAVPETKSSGPAAPGAAGELKLYDTPERDAAMIMAIVADELKLPINELRFISIKEVKK